MKKYVIRQGGSFRMPDGSAKTAGETIELASDVAALHAAMLEEVKPEQAGEPLADPPSDKFLSD